jgi:hypothetical protein
MKESWSRPPRHVLKKMRQEEAAERAAARALLSTQEKIDALDKLLGKNVGAKRERAKLQARLAEEQAIKAIKSEKKVKFEKKTKAEKKSKKKK